MKNLLYILLFLPSYFNAQDTLKYQISLGPGIELNSQLAFGADLKIRYYFTDRFFAEASTFHALFREGDYNRGYSESILNSGARLPAYNQSNLMVGYNFFGLQKASQGSEVLKTGKTTLGIRGGYYYYQQTVNPGNLAYATVDTTATGGELYICGMMVHSAFVGLEFNFLKSKRKEAKLKSIFQHRLYADFIYGFHINTSGMRKEGQQYSAYDFGDVYNLNNPGARVGYTFSHVFSKQLGYSIGCDFAYRPTIEYSENRAIFIPRGGEGFRPCQFSLKAALTFTGLRK